ncbi:MAG: hypothetical protein LDL19_04690 [Thiobacillus sp.]|nr:hypothetical protein [Thiobacillus sp.]
MSHDEPLLSKMDALMRKHRGEGEPRPPEAQPAAPPPGWLPVLTQVIERGTPPAAPAPSSADLPDAADHVTPLIEQTPAVPGEALAEYLMRELAPRLAEAMEEQVAAELQKCIDQTVAQVLSRLDVTLREIVRDAVAEKLKLPPGSP